MVTLTFQFNGAALMSARCFSSIGAATMTVNQSAEYNVWTGSTWLFTASPIINDWTYSINSNCPSGNGFTKSLTGTWTAVFPSAFFPGSTYQFWGYLYTNTSAVETSITDVIATACVDYWLSATSCAGPGSGSGNAQLTAITVT